MNPSFLVNKPSGGSRLVTAITEVAKYTKPQPALMPDVDSTLREIAKWKYLIKTDLTKAYYQVPLSKDSRKYCGTATPFRGIRVYLTSAAGMPGSETALEELMSRIFGDQIMKGCVAKIADDLYCGANTIEELLNNWKEVLEALDKCNLRLSPLKTGICPKSTTILGWIWTQGCLSASKHRISALSSCENPKNVKEMRSFIGAYRVLSRVIKDCSNILAPLESVVAGKNSTDVISWNEDLQSSFDRAKSLLNSSSSIILPIASDQLWIVTDGAVKNPGIGGTL